MMAALKNDRPDVNEQLAAARAIAEELELLSKRLRAATEEAAQALGIDIKEGIPHA